MLSGKQMNVEERRKEREGAERRKEWGRGLKGRKGGRRKEDLSTVL